MRLLSRRSAEPAVRTIAVAGERRENGKTIEIDAELDYVRGFTAPMRAGSVLRVTRVYRPGRKDEKTCVSLLQGSNAASTFRVVQGVVHEGDELTITFITYS